MLVRTRRPAGGFTLMELMVTMAIAASLMGLGVGVFLSMGKRTAAENALAGVSSLLVNVRNSSSRFPSMLVVDPAGTPTSPGSNSVQALVQEVRQELHFDPRLVEGTQQTSIAHGIEGWECDFLGNQVDPQGGRAGGALRLAGGRVDCKSYAAYDVTEGLTVEVWVKPDAAFANDVVGKGEAFRLRLEGASRLTGSISVKGDHGREQVSVSATIPPVRPGRWVGLRLAYDRTQLSVATDTGLGWVVRGRKDESRRLVPSPDASLAVGGFSGLLDDFRFAGVHSGEPFVLPPDVKLVGTKAKTIHFAGGRLDPSAHMGVERVAMEHMGRRTTLEIAANGMMTVAYTDADVEAPTSDKSKLPPKKE